MYVAATAVIQKCAVPLVREGVGRSRGNRTRISAPATHGTPPIDSPRCCPELPPDSGPDSRS